MRHSYSVSNCHDCVNMDLSDRWKYDGCKAYCSEYRKYIYINDKACSRHFEYDEHKRGYHIMTKISDVLNMGEDNNYLEKLKNLRDNFMEKDEKLKQLLVTYDTIGPEIVNYIDVDPDKRFTCFVMFELYIKPVCNLLDRGKNIEAISLYSDMTTYLKEHYQIGKEKKRVKKLR